MWQQWVLSRQPVGSFPAKVIFHGAIEARPGGGGKSSRCWAPLLGDSTAPCVLGNLLSSGDRPYCDTTLEAAMTVEHLILVRLVHLMIGSVIGLICIYFGYKLFSQIPVNLTNDGHFKMPKVGEAKLKVAPGIFFAVLGAAIVYFSIDRSINLKSNPPQSNGVQYFPK
jgi:hypothetical protein